MKTLQNKAFYDPKANIQTNSEDSSEKENTSSTMNQNEDSWSGPHHLNVDFKN